MTSTFNSAYDKLVAAWKRREELRASHADTRSLIEAKRHLDTARVEMMRARGY
jgi:hypothetical protein